MKNTLLTVAFSVALVLFMLTFSIGLPIYCRFFYYIQIKALGMGEATGWSYEVIKAAYDEVLNFLTLPGHAFGTGELKFSEEGAAHFADCKVLFNLNLIVLLSSAAVLVALLVLNKCKVFAFKRLWGRACYFYSAIVALLLPLVIGGLAAIDFDRAFEIFHAIFFPGKTNWMFDPSQDQIILVMPEQFFMNCAILIGAGLITFSCALIAADLITARRKKKKAASA